MLQLNGNSALLNRLDHLTDIKLIAIIVAEILSMIMSDTSELRLSKSVSDVDI